MSGNPWFLRAEGAWSRDWREVGAAFLDAWKFIRSHPGVCWTAVGAWLVLRLPALSLLPRELLLGPQYRTLLEILSWAYLLAVLLAKAGVCLFLFSRYSEAAREGGPVLADGWRRFGRMLPPVLSLYALYYVSAAGYYSLIWMDGPSARRGTWLWLTLASQLEGLAVRLPAIWAVCRFGGVLTAAAAGDAPSPVRSWRLTSGHVRPLLYGCLSWYVLRHAVPGVATFPLYNLLGERLLGFDWLHWLLKLYGAGVNVFFLAAAAAWYERFRSGSVSGAPSGTA
ncbi:hypothetical protein [Pseudodesulfovibrio indicus]|uniref:Acyltransferase 3 domain-containing protein n=1 Tax=Pseudodesulfovibrio indicus TaxID=1716143 RepID=A0A126QM90_9BACT|nr:hypothetical protein [Pseudodesulfovibrio indicus]AMK10545.1 hypothetical protein AWY79_05140 [Pseudodesulfovibrio indicus]TDT89051.1 hypothetical protein EDC59_10444 [Pseudodesulfovibrio indicus]